MRLAFLFACLFYTSFQLHAQFAPQAGLAGSSAISKDSNLIIEWAPNCTVFRGWLDITDTSLGKASLGYESKATGKADADVVSLGDGGEAIYFFENPVINEPGYDFAIFENGFRDPIDSNLAFLELATVDVSNDGVHYVAFPATSNTDTSTQVAGSGDYMDARLLNNLAGKYIGGYGTPFDLDELSANLSLDINNIRFIKIKDVVGTINPQFCQRDINHHKINDPYPTSFPSGGFDLDALGIIHEKFPVAVTNTSANKEIHIYPNPARNELYFSGLQLCSSIVIYNLQGQCMLRSSMQKNMLNIESLSSGNYVLLVTMNNGECYRQLFTKNEN